VQVTHKHLFSLCSFCLLQNNTKEVTPNLWCLPKPISILDSHMLVYGFGRPLMMTIRYSSCTSTITLSLLVPVSRSEWKPYQQFCVWQKQLKFGWDICCHEWCNRRIDHLHECSSHITIARCEAIDYSRWNLVYMECGENPKCKMYFVSSTIKYLELYALTVVPIALGIFWFSWIHVDSAPFLWICGWLGVVRMHDWQTASQEYDYGLPTHTQISLFALSICL
jgi:hypothetical protein